MLYSEYKKHGHRVEIHTDEYSESPRDGDNFGTILCKPCFRNDLSDSKGDFNSIEELQEAMKNKEVFVLPIYIYNHSGITIKTSPFSCPWDSGQIGYIYKTKEEVRKEYGKKRISKELEQKVFDILESEVKTYNQYFTGEVFGYKVLDNSGEELDSCWGYFGIEHVEEEANSMAQYFQEKARKEKYEKIKSFIKSKVPFIYRNCSL